MNCTVPMLPAPDAAKMPVADYAPAAPGAGGDLFGALVHLQMGSVAARPLPIEVGIPTLQPANAPAIGTTVLLQSREMPANLLSQKNNLGEHTEEPPAGKLVGGTNAARTSSRGKVEATPSGDCGSCLQTMTEPSA
ncbi:MAG TPA: hypothetical protein VHE33_06920, partial [Acidobacteriaceae bacterium]|nr:hypothetical protein [Acidobacteriaceae bacterium]